MSVLPSTSVTVDLPEASLPNEENARASDIHLKGIRIGFVAKVALHTLAFVFTAATAASIAAFVLNVVPVSVLIISAVALGILLTSIIVPRIRPYLPQKLQEIVNLVRATVVDIIAVMGLIAISPFLQTWFDPKEYVDDGKPPILLIHGYMHNSSGWAYHKYHYQKAGYQNIFTVDLGHPFHSIEEYAECVQKKVKEIETLTGKKEIRMVAHSMGGVVAAYYATTLAPQDGITVNDLVTLGSPLQGTPIAVIGVGECAKQMRYENPFVTELGKKLRESALCRFHQGSESDLIVNPASSPLNQEKVEKHVLYKDMGHASFLFSDRAIEQTLAHFQGA